MQRTTGSFLLPGMAGLPALLLAACALCCGNGGTTATKTSHEAVLPPSPSEEAWKPAQGTVLARAGSLEVLDSAVEAVLKSGEASDPSEALDRATRLEAVAAQAVREGGLPARQVAAPRYRQALVQRLIRHSLEEKLTPDTVPDTYLQQAWGTKRIRRKYVHYDSFFVSDLQLICCREPSSICVERKEDFAACFAAGKEMMEKALAIVQAKAPKDGDDYKDAVSEAIDKLGQQMTFQVFSFYFDVKRSHAENVNVVRMSKPVTEAVLEMKVGKISKLVRDQFGWHIIFLRKHVPEENRKLEEPAVRREIAEGAYAAVQKAEFSVLVSKAVETRKVEVFEERLKALRQK